MSTVSDVEQALINARVIEEYWMSNGWESLVLEKEQMTNEILDIYPLVEVDVSVQITIKLPNKTYSVPLEDVSSLSVNDCLVIEISDLYLNWEERVQSKIKESKVIHHLLTFPEEGKAEIHTRKFLGVDHQIRVIRETFY